MSGPRTHLHLLSKGLQKEQPQETVIEKLNGLRSALWALNEVILRMDDRVEATIEQVKREARK